jgi:hypothetical protein
MNDHFIFVFIRQDLSLADQLVHSSHAVFHMGAEFGPVAGIPSLVMIGIPHKTAMNRVITKLKQQQLPHYLWSDPDFDLGVTAIATIPLSPQMKESLRNYRLWSYSPGAAQAACLLTQDRGAKADVAQLREHLPLREERVGENPAVGSNSVTF